MAERYSLLPVVTGNPYPQNTARHAAYEAGRASLAANVIPEGITRDDTVHGETYFTAADMATASAQGFRDGVASLAASAGSEPVAAIHWPIGGPPRLMWHSNAALHAAIRKAHEGHQSDVPLYPHPSPPEGMVGGWQDIATAPKDGTYLLLWEQYSTNPFVGCWAFGSWSVSHEHVDAEGGWDGANVVDSISQDRITHWMPLPPPPISFADSRKGE